MKRILAVWIIITLCVGTCYAGEGDFAGKTPQGVKAASYSHSKIRVSWDVVDDADGYVVYRASKEKGPYKQCYTTDNAEKNWYINTNRKTGKVWWYKVRAFRTVNGKKVFTGYSQAVSAYARPGRVTITNISSSGFIYRYLNLEWKKVSGASGYQVSMREQGTDQFVFMGNFIEPAASIEIPDTTKEYDFRVRAYRKVDGKKVYGRFSAVTSYDFDWTEEDLVEAGRQYIQAQWPETVFSETMSDGTSRTPYNGTSWLAVWPKRFCRYEPWEEVKTELLAAIDADVKMQGQAPQDVWLYVAPDNDENWVSVYLLR